MICSDVDIEYALEFGEIDIHREYGDGLSVQPSSIDLHLGNGYIREQSEPHVVVDQKWTYPERDEHIRDKWTILPNEFVLAHTDEVVKLTDEYVGFLHGRSSVGRLGLFVHNSGLIDAAFEGQITLELFNASRNPITLKSGMRVCQLTLHPHQNPADVDYSETGKYQDQMGATPSRLYKDFESE